MGSVYILYDHLNKVIKIGRSRQKDYRREKALIAAYPYPLLHFATVFMDGYVEAEKGAHRFFAQYQTNSEYFSVAPDVALEYLVINHQPMELYFCGAFQMLLFMGRSAKCAEEKLKRKSFGPSPKFALDKYDFGKKMFLMGDPIKKEWVYFGVEEVNS